MRPKLRQLQSVIAHDGPANRVCLGPRTAQVFATGGDDRYLFLWAVGSSSHRASFGPLQSGVTSCRFDPRETRILCGNNGGTVMLFDLNEARCASNWAAHRSAVTDLSFHSKLFLSGGVDGVLNVMQIGQRRPIQTYNAHNGPVNRLSISGDGRYAATAGGMELFEFLT
jgi:WD40 repeat protein